MMTRPSLPALIAATVLLLGACSSNDPDLLTFRRGGEGPNEFTVAPAKPLETPTSQASLPVPTLGAGTNRADATPKVDAVVALGGRASATALDGVPPSDAALIRHTGRNGRDGAIRQTLATEDLEFRRRNDGLALERLSNANIYFETYERQSLDQQREMNRIRQTGVQIPGAPPEEIFPN